MQSSESSNSASAQLNRVGLEDMNIKHFFSNGSLYIVATDSLLFPLEVIKTLTVAEQYGSTKYSTKVASMLKYEGVKRFYRGLVPSVFGSFPGQATYFATYEMTQSLIKRHFHDQSGFWTSFTSGAVAEMVAGMFYVPADIISQRLQIQNLNGFHHNSRLSRSSFDVVKKIVLSEGFKGLFRGYKAHIFTYAPGSAVQWGTYEMSRKFLMKRYNTQKTTSEDYLITSFSGAVASFCSTVITNPLDVMRIRQQLLDMGNQKEKELLNGGYFQFVKKLYKQRGLGVFFKGLPVRLCISMPGSMVAMCGYETVKNMSELK